jgi:tetratricopeptide (TPR) repeat protein
MSVDIESRKAKSVAGDWRSLMDQGKLAEAQGVLAERLGAWADDCDALHDMGVISARLKRFDDAVRHFRAATAIDPGRHLTWRNLARAYSDLGKLDEAEGCLVKGVELQPKSGKAHELLGLLRQRAKRFEDAAAALRRAVELNPNIAKLHHELGAVLVELKRQKEAKASFLRAIELDGTYAEAMNHLGVLCQEMGQLDEAVKHLGESVRLRPDVVGGYNNLGVAYSESRQFEKAVEVYNKALALSPQYTIAWNNLGNALRSLGRNQPAIAALERAIVQKKDYAEAYNNLAIALVQEGEHERAMVCYNKSLCLRPDYPECHMNRGLERLMLGDLENGWADYEWRWHLKTLRSRQFSQPRWDGSPLGGKRILLHYEQGLGDTIQFIRYAAELKRRGATVVFEGQKALGHLLSRTVGIDEFVPRGETLPAFDVHSPLLSLPPLFKTTLETIPCDVPYVFPDPYFVKIWKPRLEAVKGLKVGIVWQGNPEHRGDRLRSIPLDLFERLARIDGVRLISLQKNHGVEQLAGLGSRFEVVSFDGIDEEADGFLRTAGIMQNLDLVISADTAVVHLAGAMGLPVWCLIAVANDWRWLTDREDSAWYPTLRLFRQREPGDWPEVFERVESALRERISAGMTGQSQEKCAGLARPQTREQLQKAAELMKEDRLNEARTLLEKAAADDPISAEAQHDLGVILGRQGEVHKAIDRFRRCLELRPNHVSACRNLGLAFLQAGKPKESISSLHKSIRLGGGTPEVYNHLGLALMKIPDPAAAEASYLSALHLKPDHAAAHCNLARALLIQGKFEQGWLEREWRWRARPETQRAFARPRWTGESLNNQAILLYVESGASASDVLQFIRYASVVQARGGRVLLECPENLVALLAGADGVNEVVSTEVNCERFDVHAALLSLPAILETTLETIVAPIPYLRPDPALVSEWSARMNGDQRLKVGIAWRDWGRAGALDAGGASLANFQILGQIQGVKLLSLQHGVGREEVHSAASKMSITDLAPWLQGGAGFFANVAAAIHHLDLIITTDTPLAHIAGAMGKPVWLILPVSADCRWLLGREESPWYPTLRIFRQRTANRWTPVFERIKQELKKRVAKWATTQTAVIAGPQSDVATKLLTQRVAANPDSASAHHDLAVALARQRDYEPAFSHFQTSLQFDPDVPLVAGNFALALLENGDYERASRAIRPWAQRFPDSVELQFRLALALERLGQCDEAIVFLRRVIDVRPQSAEAHYLLGRVLLAQRRHAEAVDAFAKAVELQPDLAEAHLRLGTTLAFLDKHHAAVEAFRAAIRARSRYAQAHGGLGNSLLRLGRVDEAVLALQEAVYLLPDNAQAHVNLATALLTQGNFSQGWLEFEWRLRIKGTPVRKLPGKRWRGAPLTGKTLLITVEQSLSDTIQMVRFVELAKAAGAHTILECPAPLLSLLSHCTWIDRIVPQGDPLPHCDFHSSLLSLPAGFATSMGDIPSKAAYIIPEPWKVESWRTKLPAGDRLRIGVVSSDEFAPPGDPPGAIDPQVLRVAAEIPNIELLSLQTEVGSDRAEFPELPIRRLEGFQAGNASLDDAAAVLSHCDALIACDSVMAHLAGAMGLPVFLILPERHHFRWMSRRKDTPWYSTMRLFQSPECSPATANELAVAIGGLTKRCVIE